MIPHCFIIHAVQMHIVIINYGVKFHRCEVNTAGTKQLPPPKVVRSLARTLGGRKVSRERPDEFCVIYPLIILLLCW